MQVENQKNKAKVGFRDLEDNLGRKGVPPSIALPCPAWIVVDGARLYLDLHICSEEEPQKGLEAQLVSDTNPGAWTPPPAPVQGLT